jgi:single-stranded DNA-specific DHH superfamily exonuclease
MQRLAEQRIEEARITRWQAEAEEEAQIEAMLAEMEKIDEERVTNWAEDEDEEQKKMVEEAMAQASLDVKPKKPVNPKSLLLLEEDKEYAYSYITASRFCSLYCHYSAFASAVAKGA